MTTDAALFALPVSTRAQPRLHVVPCELASANAFVREHHRHLAPITVGPIFSLAVLDDIGALRGVAIVGNPAARSLIGLTVEVRRTATDGCPNACSCLYAAANRERKRRGYQRCITYTRADEPGTSLIAAGWTCTGRVRARQWSCQSRARREHELIEKLRWEAP